MKVSFCVLLPLAASAAVVAPRPRQDTPHILVSRQTVAPAGPKDSASGSWSDTFKYVGGLVNDAYKFWGKASDTYDSLSKEVPEKLPEYFKNSVATIAWYMQWSAKPVKYEYVQPEIDPTAKKAVIRYGPFTLMGQKYNRTKLPFVMDPKADVILRTLKGLPDNAAILSGRLDTVFEDGSKADIAKGIYIHHLLVADVGKTTAPFAFCPNGHNQKDVIAWGASHVVESIGAGLIQSGNDQVGTPNVYAATSGNIKSAFMTGWDDAFALEAEIVNYNMDNTTVYFTMEAEFLPGKPAEYLDASTVIFSATGCAKPAYYPPPNTKQYNLTSEGFKMTSDGWVINSKGHLHDGGSAIEMTLNDKTVCRSIPTYGGVPGGVKAPDGKEWQTITSMSPCTDPFPFKKDDVIKLVSMYDTEEHPLRPSTPGAADGHGHSKAKARRDGGPHDGMKGMDEMGIFTTNIAINNPAANQIQGPGDKKPSPFPAAASGSSGASASASASGASPPAGPMGGMAGMPGMPSKPSKRLSKRYGLVERPGEIWPVVSSV
ncbi:hypothetical protein E2P81_ATG05028 [Venturia nashicola]|nr:hypothetical protein E2P81_ATG05028 [Venturia nashicola]